VIKKYWAEGSYEDVQPIGPSPVLIHLDQLTKLYQKWLDFSLDLRSNSAAEAVIQGWVQEMWGYSIAAASLGIRHKLIEEFQVEPGALSAPQQLSDFASQRFYVFHYTYQFEYMVDGSPCQPWNIGEWSLDKRHFNDVHPAYPLPQPPQGANAAGVWLLNAWNEAMGSIPHWPVKQPPPDSDLPPIQTLYGRRRLDWFSRHPNGFAQELTKSSLIKALADTKYTCSPGDGSGGGGSATLELSGAGDVSFSAAGSAKGRWGTMNDPVLGAGCPVGSCLFVDVGGQHNAHADIAAGRLTLRKNPYTMRRSTAAERAAPVWSCVQAT